MEEAQLSTRPKAHRSGTGEPPPYSVVTAQNKYKVGLNPIHQVAAATAGGTLTSLFVTPFDVVKTRLQAQTGNRAAIGSAASSATATAPRSVYLNGTADAFVKIIKYEGASALWRGLPATFILTVPGAAIYFTSYEKFKEQMDNSTLLQPFRMFIPGIAGLGARTLTATVTSPLELMRTNVQSHAKVPGSNESLYWMLRMVVRNQGFKGLWIGLMPTLWRDVPFSVIYWTAYEAIKARLMLWRKKEGFLVHFASGAGAGMLAALITTPVDVVKTRRQMHLDEPANLRRSSAIFMKIMKEEGVQGLFRGLLPRITKVAPACAIMISSYELFKVLL
ncbi:Carrier protein, mitochondrial [Balamuthia mandrillaris]